MTIFRRAAEAIFDGKAVAVPDLPADLASRDTATCRNCGASIETTHCGSSAVGSATPRRA